METEGSGEEHGALPGCAELPGVARLRVQSRVRERSFRIE